jgi:hypothetical protein
MLLRLDMSHILNALAPLAAGEEARAQQVAAERPGIQPDPFGVSLHDVRTLRSRLRVGTL